MVDTINHIVNDGTAVTWAKIEDAIDREWAGPSRPDQLPLVFTTNTGDVSESWRWDELNIDEI
jgi:hypothetical protein